MSYPVIICLTVTNRAASFERLLATLEPVSLDSGLYLVVLENSTSPRERVRIRAAVHAWSLHAAHPIVYCDEGPFGLPLHHTRAHLTREVMAAAHDMSDEPVVWMIDDDMTFEQLVDDNTQLYLENVARPHLELVRQWKRDTQARIIVGDVTGDPPIRPEAVLATQLCDLAHNLESMALMDPREPWRGPRSPRTQDDFYDLANRSQEHLFRPCAWLCRGTDPRVSSQFISMCESASLIARGCTPFRPKLSTVQPVTLEQSLCPPRGGNTIFLDFKLLGAHPYPSFRFEHGHSRRADMIGASLLARQLGERWHRSSLTLHHDRSEQGTIGAEPERWMPEFYGVMLARMVMSSESIEAPHSHVQNLARQRAHRIIEALSLARERAQLARHLLLQRHAWWHGMRHACVDQLHESLIHIEHVLQHLDLDQLERCMNDPDMLAQIVHHYEELCSVPSNWSMPQSISP